MTWHCTGTVAVGFPDGWEKGPLTFLISKQPLPSHGPWEGQGTRPSVVAAEGFSCPLSHSLCRDLSNNQIAEIAPDAFQGLRSLNSL